MQGVNFVIDYDVTKAQDVVINGLNCEGAKLINLNGGKSIIDIDDITNVTKAQRKGLKDGSITEVIGKYKGLEIKVTYDKEEKEFFGELNLIAVLYN